MQRQRRKDLNLKINRVLDKRSSRGMIFENEELRLRTMAIADDVDRGQNDIKKLRKENEHLKREIWNLRDECEKLEEILKKVVAAGGVPLDPSDLPYPEMFLDSQQDSFDEGSFEDDDQMALMRNMFMTEEDQNSATGSVVEVPLASTGQNMDFDTSVDIQSSPEVLSDSSPPKFGGIYHSHPSWGPTAIPPDLEAVREETESIVTSVNTMSNSPIDIDQLPDPNRYSIGFEEIIDTSVDNNHLAASQHAPLIEITPASSPSSNPMDPETSQSPSDLSNDVVQDGGCVAVLPKMFQVTSQIHFDNSADNNMTLDYQIQRNVTDFSSAPRPLNALPPSSPSQNFKGNAKQLANRRRTAGKDSDSMSTFSSESTSTRPHSVSGDQPSKESEVKNQSMSRRMYLSNRRNSQISQILTATKSPFGGSIGFIVNRCCPNFHSCYQSDPSSLATGEGDDRFNSGHMTLDKSTGGFCYPFLNCQADKQSWNSIDTNLVVGYLNGEPSQPANSFIKPQDVIDELEVKFDSSLEKVKGIRMLPGRVFISFRDPSCVKYLLNEFGSESAETNEHFMVKGQRVVFMDGSEKYSEISLSGIPPDVSDLAVTSVLNQYGQVVAPLERRNYKGVDISERFARVHLVKTVPNVLSIGGYEVLLSVVPNDECQNEGNLQLQHQQLVQPVSTDSYVNVSPHVNVEQTRPPVVTSNSKEPPSACGNNPVTCHSSPVMSNRNTSHIITSQNIQTSNPNSSVTTSNIPTATGASHPVPSSSSTPQPNEGLKPHKQVIRSTSSNPRLETGPKPLSPVVSKRQTSVCTGNIHPEEHPSKITAPSTPTNPKTLKVNGGTNSAPNLLPGNPKKPLSRLLRSSPGSLVPPSPNIMTGAKLIEPNDPGSTQVPGPAAAMNANGLRAAFYRSLSIDPRRGSMVSQAGENNNIEKVGIYSRRGSHNVFQGRAGGHSGHPPLTQMNSNSSSQFESRDSVGRGFGGSGPKEPLPWCGCWGNGCI